MKSNKVFQFFLGEKMTREHQFFLEKK